jgi:hypothetical protein
VTTVLIADDQPMQRFGFRMLLESQDDMTVVGEAANGHEALNLVSRYRPDVALMDIRMPLLDGIEATRRIIRTGSRTRVLIVTTFDTYRPFPAVPPPWTHASRPSPNGRGRSSRSSAGAGPTRKSPNGSISPNQR